MTKASLKDLVEQVSKGHISINVIADEQRGIMSRGQASHTWAGKNNPNIFRFEQRLLNECQILHVGFFWGYSGGH